MANPNIVGVTSILAATSYLIPSNTSATPWTALTPNSNSINKIAYITAANVTSANATVTVSINSAIAGGGTAYRLINQATVPPNSSLIISDKITSIYVGESQSIVVTVSTGNAIELVASYETLT
jgi:hypothetical protein